MMQVGWRLEADTMLVVLTLALALSALRLAQFILQRQRARPRLHQHELTPAASISQVKASCIIPPLPTF
jgi:hypothetical protein